MKKIIKIAIVGGSCAGKTSLMAEIEKNIFLRDWHLMIIPETATELIMNGIKCFGTNAVSSKDFQSIVIEKQIHKELLYKKTAYLSPCENILIVCDRGMLDGAAFIDKDIFENEILYHAGKNTTDALNEYDAVIHLVTAANGAKECYNLDNPARIETPEEAIIQDDKIGEIWSKHKNYIKINNSTDFAEKIRKALNFVFNIVGIPYVKTYQKKYLVSLDNFQFPLHYKKMEILQTYLNNSSLKERRIRKMCNDSETVYFLSESYYDSDKRRVKTEKIISEEEYTLLLHEKNPNIETLEKTRYFFPLYDCTLDVFPFEKNLALLEKNCDFLSDSTLLVNTFDIVKEVTNDEKYNNINIAKSKSLRRED